ncbi:hypothetical protein A1D29_03470 [Pasteurellaceae bacterium Orientalotternb1]|nr:hypothetical protein A1D29_03470 [Pasteurellaceae bacterium Orientalotternb1]
MSGGSSNKLSPSKMGGMSSGSNDQSPAQVAKTISNSVLSIVKSPMVSSSSNKKPVTPTVSAKPNSQGSTSKKPSAHIASSIIGSAVSIAKSPMVSGSSNKKPATPTVSTKPNNQGGISAKPSAHIASGIIGSTISTVKSPMVSGSSSNNKPVTPIVSAKLAGNVASLIASTAISASKQPIINTKPEISYHFKSNGLNSIANIFKPENSPNNLSNTSIKPEKNELKNIGKISLNSDLKENLSNNLNYISTTMDIVGNYSNPESLKTVLNSWSNKLGKLGDIIDTVEITSNVMNGAYIDAAKNTRDWLTNIAGGAAGARLGAMLGGPLSPITIPIGALAGSAASNIIYTNDNDEIRSMINERTGLPADIILPLDHPINTEYLSKLESIKPKESLDSSINQLNKLIESMSNFSSEKSSESVIKSDKDTNLHPLLTLPSN